MTFGKAGPAAGTRTTRHHWPIGRVKCAQTGNNRHIPSVRASHAVSQGSWEKMR
jgi:hypothetical protein